MKFEAGKRVRAREIFLILLVSGFLSTLVVFCQQYSFDEGIYLYASRLFYSGLKPYQDFFLDKLPLLPIIYGLPQFLFTPGLFLGRLTATVFFLSTVYLIIIIGEKISGRRAAIIAGIFYGCKMSYLVGNCLVFTYSPSIFFFTLSLLTFFAKRTRYSWLLTVLFWCLATQIRQIYAAAIPFLFFAEYKRSKRGLLFLGAETMLVSAVSCLYLIPFFYGNENAYQDLWVRYLTPYYAQGMPFWEVKLYWLRGTLNEYYPELIIGSILLVHHFFTSRIKLKHPHALFMAMSAMLILASFKSYYTFSIYNLITAPMLALLIGISIHNLWLKSPKLGKTVLILLICLLFIDSYKYLKRYSLVGSKFYCDVKFLSREIARYTAPNDQILSFTNHLLVESERKAIPLVTYSLVSISPRYNNEECKKYHLVNPDLLQEIVADKKVAMIQISNRSSRILETTLGKEWLKKFSRSIERNYRLVTKHPNIHQPQGNFFLFKIKG